MNGVRSQQGEADAIAVSSMRRVLLVDFDVTLHAMLKEWLGELGHSVIGCHTATRAAPTPADLAVVDLPPSIERGQELLSRLRQWLPGMPLLALSSNVMPGIDSAGAVARALGAQRVLPKPVTRQVLCEAVASLLEEGR